MFKTESLTALKQERGLYFLVLVSFELDWQLVIRKRITFLFTSKTKITVNDTIASPIMWEKPKNTKLKQPN